ncbi:MAG: hypothetical protein QOE14_2825 [Humisphaera sp.]|nr:hypothetical protein [Humisphaera sp.]
MRRPTLNGAVVGLICLLGLAANAPSQDQKKNLDWSFNATNIEACSCEMFCPCYFTGAPSPAAGGGHDGHSGMSYCRFNNAFKVNTGHFGDTKLDGVKFWMAGDLGADFSKGFDWAVLTFEPGTPAAQRDAIKQIVQTIFAGKWNSFSDGADAKIDWSLTKDRAVAKLDDGKAAEIVLKRNQGLTDDPIVIQNLKFWAAPRNDGFKMMQNEVQAYRLGDKAFETKGTNGFAITIDMKSSDVK